MPALPGGRKAGLRGTWPYGENICWPFWPCLFIVPFSNYHARGSCAMKTYEAADIRNFAIVGHASSGKTMLSEAMLMCSGVINRLGSIAAGNTVSDYHDDEQERGISIHTSLLRTEWLGKKFNIIDTPGYLDFISEGLGALRVGDFALVVIHGQHGLGVGTGQVWKYATTFNIPKMIVVNAMDKENVDFEALLAQCRARFGSRVFPLN